MLGKAVLSVLVIICAISVQAATPPEPIIGPAGVNQGNSHTLAGSLSSNASFIAFESYATNFTNAGSGKVKDIYLKNRTTNEIVRCSKSHDLGFANASSSEVAITPDGRFVAFTSRATNLVPNDNNNAEDIFVYDRLTDTVTRESVSTTGQEANNRSLNVSISGDGRFVVFTSNASNFVPNDTANSYDIFLRDRQQQTTTRISVNLSGSTPNQGSYSPSISNDGSTVVFNSKASDLVANDSNNNHDIFVYNRINKTISAIRTPSGYFGNGLSYDASVSGDGNIVVFSSTANNFITTADKGGDFDVFSWKRDTDTIKRLSTILTNSDPAGPHFSPEISTDGKLVVFATRSTALFDGAFDYSGIVITDPLTAIPLPVLSLPIGQELTGDLFSPRLDPTAKWLIFSNNADNVFPNDSNAHADAVIMDTDIDFCPSDPLKKLPQVCGCGVPDIDSDNDGAVDCVDLCPFNKDKTTPEICGCNNTESDLDFNGAIDCLGYPGNSYTLSLSSEPPLPLVKTKKKNAIVSLPFLLTSANSLVFRLRKKETVIATSGHTNLQAIFKKLSPGKYKVNYSWNSPYGKRSSLYKKFQIKGKK